MKHLKILSMLIIGGLVLSACSAKKSPTTAILEHNQKKVNQNMRIMFIFHFLTQLKRCGKKLWKPLIIKL